MILKKIFGNRYKIYMIKGGKNSKYEVYQRIFFGLYMCIGTFSYKEARKYMKEMNIELDFE